MEPVAETPEVAPAPAAVEESPAVPTEESKDVKVESPETPVEKEAVPETGNNMCLRLKFALV